VLKAPDFPSVLVELGYLSNAKDVQAMKSPEWRTRTASAMAEAVERFFPPSRASAAPAAGVDALAASDKPAASPPIRPSAPASPALGAAAKP
jgi:N-acetylmuramoyl-L-alanine amidase